MTTITALTRDDDQGSYGASCRITGTKYNGVGGWAIAYESNGSIRAKFYDKDLVALKSVQANTFYKSYPQKLPDICWNPVNENVLVSWTNTCREPDFQADLMMRLYDDSGIPAYTPERVATTKTLGYQYEGLLCPLTKGPNKEGRWLISYSDAPLAKLVIIGADGAIHTSDTNAQEVPTDQLGPTSAEIVGGHIVTSWTDAKSLTVKQRFFTGKLTRVTGEVKLPSDGFNGTNTKQRLGYANLFLWMVSQKHYDAGGSGTNVVASIYNQRGQLIVPEFIVHNETKNEQSSPELVVLSTGKAIIVWADRRKGNTQIYAKMFDTDGSTIVDEFLVNDSLTENQENGSPDIAVLPDESRIAITWNSRPVKLSPAYNKPYAKLLSLA